MSVRIEIKTVLAAYLFDCQTDIRAICAYSFKTVYQIQKIYSGLIVLATGAYNYSMASNYNRIPRPAMISVSNGEAKVVIKRETYEDLIKNDL